LCPKTGTTPSAHRGIGEAVEIEKYSYCEACRLLIEALASMWRG